MLLPGCHMTAGTGDAAVDPEAFYDDVAEYYDLVYTDWEESMRRHGAAISTMLNGRPCDTRILDVSAGIGTQALSLASLGYKVVARDLSSGAIRRLRREAKERGLEIDAACSDMRDVGRSVHGRFNAVISFDNSLPHLLTDAEILTALRGFRDVLVPDGQLLVSVRDYEQVDRSATSVHPYGERVRAGRRFRLSQHWRWDGPSHYRTTMVIEEQREEAWIEVVQTEAKYYAIPILRLIALVEEAGFNASRVKGSQFFQPVVRASPR